MIDNAVKIDVRALAALVRMEVSDTELAKLEQEIPAILTFVETIKNADVSSVSQDTTLRNVMREDIEPHESGMYTEALLSAAPSREGNRIAVKQVLTRAESFRKRSDLEAPSVSAQQDAKNK